MELDTKSLPKRFESHPDFPNSRCLNRVLYVLKP